MKRFLITALLLITFIGNVLADDVTFVASAPKSVVVNQHFKLSYTINTTDAKEPVIQDFKGFEVLSGPNPSTRQSYSSVNGNVTTSVSVTFTYILLAKEEGTFTIPAASIKAAGKELQSNSVTIKVLPEGQQSSGAPGSAGSARSPYAFAACGFSAGGCIRGFIVELRECGIRRRKMGGCIRGLQHDLVHGPGICVALLQYGRCVLQGWQCPDGDRIL